MPEATEPNSHWYSYAVIRVMPLVERDEFINVGVIVFARTLNYLEAQIHLDEARLKALAGGTDLDEVRRHLDAFLAVARGDSDGGPMAAMSQSERFHWLTTPRSTVIQTSPAHLGRCEDPARATADLMQRYVT